MGESALVVGASRGLGWGLARELVQQGWRVVGTVRDARRPSRLHELKAACGHTLTLEQVDITRPGDIESLRTRLTGARFDLLFVVAGISNDIQETIGDVSTEEFVRVLVTNALSPLRVVEALIELVTPTGQIAVMSSELGSVADNTDGG
jgi:NAD(P)-dependent dehydrogenase (short-subunit alcohol dehydrogenase family)